MGNITMPEVEQATHLGIIKTTTMKHNIQTNVDENITKARRSAYSLFGCGFHGHNGLDPESLLHIYKTYITPVLLYGMELLLPSSKPLEQLELFQKRILKQILSLPMSCPDPAVYILIGILPIEAQIHIKPSHSSITSVIRAKKTLRKRRNLVRDRPFNLKEGYGFLFRSEFFFRTIQENIIFFLSRKARIFFPDFRTSCLFFWTYH